ncbi:NAD(P)(+)--arginine ADP-ribosyltransferase 2-like [Astyanax mexicanus]|uniref:NAD(P)(+)--arginine ADP-ribosyltransferase n=1 Tax=Astyanax mexicanus TaxID=7994 RepID=W5KD69_ASTMX|nr:NAD(P)(+)--arginine ADP-ribosyltransferase 2-like [Astyanax mexicanus]
MVLSCMKMTVFVVSVLLLVTVSVSVQMRISGQVLPLDMAEGSVDDSYEGCKDPMFKLVNSKYIEEENNATAFCSAGWKKAPNHYQSTGLGRHQSTAIRMYTENCVYLQFNNASRNGSAEYKSGDFQFYSLHFFLTDAIQQLKRNQTGCLTTYRRTNIKFQKDVLNKTVRFGSFTSTSLKHNLHGFGSTSCFKVETCFGASVEKYSAFPSEREVLIPPYEVFRVTSIKKNTHCNVVYELKSVGKKSNLQCIKIKNTSTVLVPSLFTPVLMFNLLHSVL